MKRRGTVDKALYLDSTGEGHTPDFNPNVLCNPRQVLPHSWDSFFLLLFSCLFYCNCDLWGREGDNCSLVENILGVAYFNRSPLSSQKACWWKHSCLPGLISILLGSSWALGNSACSRHPQWHQETALKWGISLNGRDSPRFPGIQYSSTGIPRVQGSWLIFFFFLLVSFFTSENSQTKVF